MAGTLWVIKPVIKAYNYICHIFWKIIMKDKWEAKFILHFYFFLFFGLFQTQKILFHHYLYLGQMTAREASFATPVGLRHTRWPTQNRSHFGAKKKIIIIIEIIKDILISDWNKCLID